MGGRSVVSRGLAPAVGDQLVAEAHVASGLLELLPDRLEGSAAPRVPPGQGLSPWGAAHAHDHRLPTNLTVDGAFTQRSPPTVAPDPETPTASRTMGDHEPQPTHLVHHGPAQVVVTGSRTSPRPVPAVRPGRGTSGEPLSSRRTWPPPHATASPLE